MADAQWWVPLVAGAIGAAGGIGGGGLTHLLTRRRDREQWVRQIQRQDAEWRRQRLDNLRGLRAELYLHLMEYLQNMDNRLLVELVDRPDLLDPIPDVEPLPRLTARIGLYADDELELAWSEVLSANNAVIAEWDSTGGHHGVAASTVEEARAAIGVMQGILRDRVQEVENATGE